MNKLKKLFSITAFFTITVIMVSGQDKLSNTSQVEINGYIGEKLDASYNNRILAQDVDKLVQPFTVKDEHSCWQSEFWGKWFTSAVLAYNYNPTPVLAEKLKYAVDELIKTQTKDGYIATTHLKVDCRHGIYGEENIVCLG